MLDIMKITVTVEIHYQMKYPGHSATPVLIWITNYVIFQYVVIISNGDYIYICLQVQSLFIQRHLDINAKSFTAFRPYVLPFLYHHTMATLIN